MDIRHMAALGARPRFAVAAALALAGLATQAATLTGRVTTTAGQPTCESTVAMAFDRIPPRQQ